MLANMNLKHIPFMCTIPSLTVSSSSSSSNGIGILLVAIFSVIAVIAVVGIAVLIVVIIIVMKKKANSSTPMAPAALVCETVDESNLTRNKLDSDASNAAVHATTCTSTDTVLYDTILPLSHTIKMQPNPAYGRSDKIVMINSPAYK